VGAPSGINYVVAIQKLSEITELSGSKGVRTFRKSWSLLAGT